MTQPSRANAVLPTWGARGNHTANPSGRGPPGRAGRAPRTATRSPRPQQTPQNRPPDRVGLTQHAQLRPQPGRASWEPWGSRGQNQPLPPRALRAGMDPPCRPCGRRGRATRPCVWVDAFLCDRTGLGGGRAHTRATTGHPCPPEDQPWPFEDPRGLAPVPGGLSPSSDTKRPGHRPRGRALCVSVGCAKVSVCMSDTVAPVRRPHEVDRSTFHTIYSLEPREQGLCFFGLIMAQPLLRGLQLTL